jgi:hypothetical protein
MPGRKWGNIILYPRLLSSGSSLNSATADYMDVFPVHGLTYDEMLHRVKGYKPKTIRMVLDVWLQANFSSDMLPEHPFYVFENLLQGAPVHLYVQVLTEWLRIRGVTLTVT